VPADIASALHASAFIFANPSDRKQMEVWFETKLGIMFCSRKVPRILNSRNNQTASRRWAFDTYVKKGGCYETDSPCSVGARDCGCGSANISERAVRTNLLAHAGIGGTRGSSRAFATTRTHRRDHAFLTTGIDGRRVRVAMSTFAM
jgi:hypothetical protein